jgi:hypothetical protein
VVPPRRSSRTPRGPAPAFSSGRSACWTASPNARSQSTARLGATVRASPASSWSRDCLSSLDRARNSSSVTVPAAYWSANFFKFRSSRPRSIVVGRRVELKVAHHARHDGVAELDGAELGQDGRLHVSSPRRLRAPQSSHGSGWSFRISLHFLRPTRSRQPLHVRSWRCHQTPLAVAAEAGVDGAAPRAAGVRLMGLAAAGAVTVERELPATDSVAKPREVVSWFSGQRPRGRAPLSLRQPPTGSTAGAARPRGRAKIARGHRAAPCSRRP